jgi:hypothetical protein
MDQDPESEDLRCKASFGRIGPDADFNSPVPVRRRAGHEFQSESLQPQKSPVLFKVPGFLQTRPGRRFMNGVGGIHGERMKRPEGLRAEPKIAFLNLRSATGFSQQIS